MKTCSKCGGPNDEAVTRCVRCGARLPRTAAPERDSSRRDGIEPVKTHMGLAVLATILFVPFGVLSILQAGQVNGWYAAGEYDRARRTSALGRRWALAGILTGLILNPLLILAARLV